MIWILEKFFPNWRDLTIHESSPGGASSEKLQTECKQYLATHFFPETNLGTAKDGFRCENLERQTFADGTFDLVITQDVLEHVLDPSAAFREIARTLKPGGAHVFTVPCYFGKKTLVRAASAPEGIVYLAEKEYHRNPIDPAGSLVVTEWGDDLVEFIRQHSGLTTTAFHVHDRSQGIDGKFIEVFVSRRSPDS